MKKIFLLFILSPFITSAQKQGKPLIDSLIKELYNNVSDTNKINLLNKISFAYGYSDYNEGIRYGNLALQLAQKKQWNKGIGFAYFNVAFNNITKSSLDTALIYLQLSSRVNSVVQDKNLEAKLNYGYGTIYMSTSQFSKALQSFQNSINISTKLDDKSLESICLVMIGLVWNKLSNPLKAIEYLHKALEIAEHSNDYYLMGIAYDNLATVYYYFDNKQSIENYQKAFKYFKLIDHKLSMAMALGNIGLVQTNLLNYDSALNYNLAALKIYEKEGMPLGAAFGGIGYVYDKMDNYVKALEYYKKALSEDQKALSKGGVIDDLIGLGDIYNRMHDSDMVKIGELPSSRNKAALDYASKGLALAHESGTAENLSDAWKLIYEIHERQNNVPKAYEAYKNYIVFRDSNVNKANNQELTRRDMQFGFDKQQLSDSLKNEETKRIARFKLQKQRTYTYGAFAGVGMLVLLSFFIFKNYNTQKKSNKMLAIEKNKSDNLLLNILPAEVAEELKHKGYAEAKHFDDVTVLFSDFVNFTGAAERMSPQELVTELDNCFTAFDEIVGKYNIEKIKTIGDAYMAVCGLPAGNTMHAQNIMMAALEIRDFMRLRNNEPGTKSFNIRIGIHSGSVVAGIVGTKKFAYDIWGDAVNTAARMEQNSEKGMINISEKSYDLVKDEFNCTYRGELEAKNKGKMKMYFMESKKDI